MLRLMRDAVRRQMHRHGFSRNDAVSADPRGYREFSLRASEIKRRHDAQTPEIVAQLARKYEKPIIGEVEVYRLLELLAQCIDPSNRVLFCASQLTHTLQVMDELKLNGVADHDVLVTGLVHDLGKIALLFDEDPWNIEGEGKQPLGQNKPGQGLAQSNLTFDHGDIAYARLKPYLSEECAWLVRFHSITKQCHGLMNARDRELKSKYLDPFVEVDRTYSYFRMPRSRLSDYREFIAEAFPTPILF